jgi:hypothetical protein
MARFEVHVWRGDYAVVDTETADSWTGSPMVVDSGMTRTEAISLASAMNGLDLTFNGPKETL